MDIEISIQAQTKIEILGPMPKEEEPERVYAPISLEQTYTSIGQNVCVDAYIRTKIENVVYNNYSYGSGAITDLHYRLPVNVTTFSENGNPGKGSYVRVNGEVRESKLGTILLQVESMDQIKILDDEAKTDAEMKLGFRPIKKGVLSEVSETQEPPAKKANIETQCGEK